MTNLENAEALLVRVTGLEPGDRDCLAVAILPPPRPPRHVEDPATIARVVRLILAGGLPSLLVIC